MKVCKVFISLLRAIIQIFFGRNHKDKPVLTNHACRAINTIYLKTSRIFTLYWKVVQYFKCCFNNFTQRKSLHLCYISNTLRYLIIEHKKISDQWNKTFENKTDKIKLKVTFLVGITNISIKTNLWTLNILTPKTRGFHCVHYLTAFSLLILPVKNVGSEFFERSYTPKCAVI